MLVTVFLIVVLLVFLLQRVCVEPGNWATCDLSDYLILFTKWEQQSEQVTGNLWRVFFLIFLEQSLHFIQGHMTLSVFPLLFCDPPLYGSV